MKIFMSGPLIETGVLIPNPAGPSAAPVLRTALYVVVTGTINRAACGLRTATTTVPATAAATSVFGFARSYNKPIYECFRYGSGSLNIAQQKLCDIQYIEECIHEGYERSFRLVM